MTLDFEKCTFITEAKAESNGTYLCVILKFCCSLQTNNFKTCTNIVKYTTKNF